MILSLTICIFLLEGQTTSKWIFRFWFWNLGFIYVEFWWIYLHRYHLKDVIVGKIYFLLVRIKIKHMEIQIIKRESTGTGICSHYRTQSTLMFFLKFLFKMNRIFIKSLFHNCFWNSMTFPVTFEKVHVPTCNSVLKSSTV